MKILGIESSCDETAAAVVEDGRRILSSVVASQEPIHAKYGGVVPELASRAHVEKIVPIVREACERAGLAYAEVDAVAATQGPGLIGSLLVGWCYAKAMASALGKPLVPVNHLEGHIHAVLLEAKQKAQEEPELPAMTLVVSGGHTHLYRVEKEGKGGLFRYVCVGQTRDDAAGEAYDKVAKLLALGYPGGPVIDRLAPCGNPRAVRFGRPKMKGNPFDFSFSGIKTAVLYYVRDEGLKNEAEERRQWRKQAGKIADEELCARTSQKTLDLIASFQHAVVEDLVERTLKAADHFEMKSVMVSGGVASNRQLRVRFSEAAPLQGYPVFFPSPGLSTDNAAMIAAAGYYKCRAGEVADPNQTAAASFAAGHSVAVIVISHFSLAAPSSKSWRLSPCSNRTAVHFSRPRWLRCCWGPRVPR